MDAVDLTRIRVGKSCDEEVASFMLKELSAHNYVPDGARDEYGKAFMREFPKAIGLVVTGSHWSHHQGLDIQVLGIGCAQCDSLEQMTMGLLAELNLPASLDPVTDIKEMAQYGVLGTPGVIINEKVVAVGKVPPRNQIKAWPGEARESVAGK